MQNSSKSKGQSGETTTLGEPRLVEFIRETIRRDGPVPFRWFMEQALYHPEHGYYSSGRAVIGRGGDYFTNVSVGPLFGRLMAAQFTEMWTLLGKPDELVVVEQGAHDGQLADDVLRAVQQRAPEFFDALTYRIVEPLPVLEQRQRAILAGFNDKVEWRRTVADLEPLTGVHFSNELLDALPVHLVRWS
ncbi:MAG: SAM-dependent methyltransferase, partial [Verrucomicrobiota bacterium]|nr:SAM-dependent methyltransferase [Verrucomicrobiota bacterium]